MPKPGRFFAQVAAMGYACPNCNYVHKIRRGHQRSRSFNTFTGIIRCEKCRQRWYVGIVFWKIKPGAFKGGHEDQIPTARELAQLRDEAEERGLDLRGRLMPRALRRADRVNRVVDSDADLQRELDQPEPERPKPSGANLAERGGNPDSFPEE